jgi:hypothetical protein
LVSALLAVVVWGSVCAAGAFSAEAPPSPDGPGPFDLAAATKTTRIPKEAAAHPELEPASGSTGIPGEAASAEEVATASRRTLLADAVSTHEPVTVRLATGSVGGTFLPVGHDLAGWFERTLPWITVLVDTTAGSVDNLSRLVQGEADIAIVGASPFRATLEARARLALAREAQEICLLGTLYDDAEQYVIRASLVRAESMLDLNGVHMYPGPRNSGAEVDTRSVLSTLGIEPNYVYPIDRDKGYAEAAEALAEGEFDACTFSGGVPISALTELLRKHPREFEILPFTRHQLSKVRHANLDYEQVTIPAGAYPGLEEDLTSVGGPNILVAGPDLSAEIMLYLDAAIREGVTAAGRGLRSPESHPVLQILTGPLWDRPSVGGDCLGRAQTADQAPE